METPKQETYSLPFFPGPESGNPLYMLDPELTYVISSTLTITEVLPFPMPEAHRVYGDFDFETEGWSEFQILVSQFQALGELWTQGLAAKAKAPEGEAGSASAKITTKVKSSKHNPKNKKNNRNNKNKNKYKYKKTKKVNANANANASELFQYEYDSEDGNVTPRPLPMTIITDPETPTASPTPTLHATPIATPTATPLYLILVVPWSKSTMEAREAKESGMKGRFINERVIDIHRAQDLEELLNEKLPRDQIIVDVELAPEPRK